MKKLTFGLIFLAGACDSYKVSPLDNRALVDTCTKAAACEMDEYDDSDYYDIKDEAVLEQYLIESCVDNYYDSMTIASDLGCKAEYKAYMDCSITNAPNSCDYDDDEYDDYEEDYTEYSQETCWKVIQKYNECMIFDI